jgi:hypothetical protein
MNVVPVMRTPYDKRRCSMVYRGTVRNGVVELEDGNGLPDGTVVRVEPVSSAVKPSDEEDIPTLYEQLEPFIGIVKDLPPDMARNHDHYLHGQPKR